MVQRHHLFALFRFHRTEIAAHSPREVVYHQYEFFCHACKKFFDKLLSLVDYEEGDILCPHCGSKNVEQRWSALSAITSKKSA